MGCQRVEGLEDAIITLLALVIVLLLIVKLKLFVSSKVGLALLADLVVL